MKVTTRKIVTLGVGLLGISAAFGIATPTLAAPRNNDVREERRDVKDARRDVKDARRDVRRANTPAQRRNQRRDVKDARQDLHEERHELRQERREDGVYNRPGQVNRPGWNNRPGLGNRPGVGRGYAGTVTNLRSNQSFDINIGGNTFNVYTVSRLPRGLSVGDTVRVSGVQQYNNDIRNAGVTIIRNR